LLGVNGIHKDSKLLGLLIVPPETFIIGKPYS
jgi:hypothetical protein